MVFKYVERKEFRGKGKAENQELYNSD
jgi:hypothetical protein